MRPDYETPVDSSTICTAENYANGNLALVNVAKRLFHSTLISVVFIRPFPAVTNARFSLLHGLSVAFFPFDDACSVPQFRTFVTSDIYVERRSGRLPSAARQQALRCGCISLGAPFRPPLHSPARRPQIEAGINRKVRILRYKMTWPFCLYRI